ncbi:MAG: CUAEP/CCAEP-tail radical SAM protein [Chloroflexi bacterium]|nr:CUAEP/CCAEP-tail radical SAM protein [Chloroflexota bacterium]MDA1239997.1 CUAEP/CCAEP-tail radical SAM protein [Chloroflexota bacterium]
MTQPAPLTFETLPGRASVTPTGAGAKVLLVSTYELGHQPLGLAWPAAALRAAGHDVRTLDVAVETLEAGAFRGVDLVAISVPMHTAARIGMEVARAARRVNPQARVAFYGLYASPLHAYLVADGLGDVVIGGEYEDGLVAVAGRVAAGDADLAVAGSGATPYLGRPEHPVPDRRGLPSLDRYASVRRSDGEHPAGYVEATRGCAHRCTHCPITPVYGGALRLVPRDTVLADAAQQIEAGARHITFGDPDFLNAVPHSMAIVEEFHRRWPDITYDATIKVEHLIEHEAVLPRLKETGCIFITSAFESCNDQILAWLEKGHTADDMRRALAIAQAAGLVVRPTWVAFTPWTTLDDTVETLEFVAAHGLQRHIQPIQYTLRLLLPPGSPLNAVLESQGLLGPFDAEHLTYTWANPDPRVDALQARLAEIVEAAAIPATGEECDEDGVCAIPGSIEDAAETFERVRAAAYAAAGRERPPRGLVPMRFVPSLSEAWYCCAEPTEQQLHFAEIATGI